MKQLVFQANRIKKNLSQQELADMAGLSQGAIAKYETGKRNPSRRSLQALSKVFYVSPEVIDVWLKTYVTIEEPENNEMKLRKLVRFLVNELCLRCNTYREEHLGRCDGCRMLPIRHGDLTNEGIDTTDSEEATK